MLARLVSCRPWPKTPTVEEGSILRAAFRVPSILLILDGSAFMILSQSLHVSRRLYNTWFWVRSAEFSAARAEKSSRPLTLPVVSILDTSIQWWGCRGRNMPGPGKERGLYATRPREAARESGAGRASARAWPGG